MQSQKVRRYRPAVSHIPQFEDATTSSAGDVNVSAVQWETAASPTGDLLASPNFGICDTTHTDSKIHFILFTAIANQIYQGGSVVHRSPKSQIIQEMSEFVSQLFHVPMINDATVNEKVDSFQ